MRAVLAILSISVLGCSLFSKSDGDSPGANAPIMYGTGPGVGGPGGSGGGGFGGAGTTGMRLDAAIPSGGSGGNSGRKDGGPDAVKPPTDIASHADAQRWIRFPSFTFTKCTWFSTVEGFCNDSPRSVPGLPTLQVYVFRTGDAGKTWVLTSPIDTEATATDGSINVYVLSSSDMWYISGSVSAGPSGSVGHSVDGGKNWMSLTSAVSALLSPPAKGDAGATSVPVWQLASSSGRIWLLPQGGNLAYSTNAGLTWSKIAAPADFAAATNRSFITTQGYLLLQFLAPDNSLGLYRWNGTAFVPAGGTFPPSSTGNQTGTWWRSSPNVEGVLFADRGPLPAWGSPFWVYATTDGGQTFRRLLDGEARTNDLVGLSDGLAFASLISVTSFVGGIFTDSSNGRYLEIHRTFDAGNTWSTLHSEPSYVGDNSTISLSIDSGGAIHAMHTIYNADGIGPAITYDAHYVLQ